jgi:hypothetical protein
MKKLIAVGLVLAASAAFALEVHVEGVTEATQFREVIVTETVPVAAIRIVSISILPPQETRTATNGVQIAARPLSVSARWERLDKDGKVLSTGIRRFTAAEVDAALRANGSSVEQFLALFAAIAKADAEAVEPPK